MTGRVSSVACLESIKPLDLKKSGGIFLRRNGFDIDFAFGCLCRLGSHAFLISGGVLFHGIKKSLAVGTPATKKNPLWFIRNRKWRVPSPHFI